MFGIGSQELMIIMLIAFFIFGAKRLPELGKSLGESIRAFKNSMEDRPRIERPQEGKEKPKEDKAAP